MQVETKFLRLSQPVALGFEIDGWRVCWLGGWGKNRLFFFVMVMRLKARNPNLVYGAKTTVTPAGTWAKQE